MERVTGIGGFFLGAVDPGALGDWYAEHLGIDPIPTDYGQQPWRQEAGPTAFAAMPAGTDMFRGKSWAINFRVRDLDAMVEQLRAAGITVDVDEQTYPNGRFAELADPEGNVVQLWQPAD
jgi:glyoxylase I family protein